MTSSVQAAQEIKPLVYMVVNRASGKMYFGVTKRGLENRKKEHIRTAKQGYKSVLCHAIRKYGPDEFAFIMVREFDDYQSALQKEIDLIAKYNPAYNVAAGGEGLNYWLGKKRDAATNEKISKTKTGVPRGYTPPHCLLIFAENMRRASRARRKPVRCINDGREFYSATAANDFYELRPLSVASVANGRRNSIFGLKFEYIKRYQ